MMKMGARSFDDDWILNPEYKGKVDDDNRLSHGIVNNKSNRPQIYYGGAIMTLSKCKVWG